jgi:endonuclease/exonuclease/phosphatase (EEP) superfamily protein YafD
MRRKLLTLLAALLLGIFAIQRAHARTRAIPHPPPRNASAPALTIASYNLNAFDPADPETLDALRALDADVIFLQETNEEWERAIRDSLGPRYPQIEFHHCCAAGGVGVLSKVPFESRDLVPGRFFPAWIVTLHSALGDVQAIDVHLRPPLTGRGPFKGYFSNRGFRLGEVQLFAQHLQANVPTIWIGDFNEHELKAVGWLESRGWTDALVQFPVSQRTWHWRIAGITVHDTLDHVMTSSELAAVDARVFETGGSDHFPLRVVLQRR